MSFEVPGSIVGARALSAVTATPPDFAIQPEGTASAVFVTSHAERSTVSSVVPVTA